MREEIESSDYEDNGAQYLKQNPLCPAALESADEMRNATEDQQPAEQQHDTDGRGGGLDNRKQTQDDEQHRCRNVPTRESLRPLDHWTIRCHVTPPAYRSWDRMLSDFDTLQQRKIAACVATV